MTKLDFSKNKLLTKDVVNLERNLKLAESKWSPVDIAKN